jgi:hypothetical protein
LGLLWWLESAIFGPKGGSVDLVRRFYSAIGAEDYGAAFQCLGGSLTAPEGGRLTLESFTRREQAITATQGPLSSWKITNWGGTNGWRWLHITPKFSYTVKVTRGDRSKKVHPRVENEDFAEWRIVAFDPNQRHYG